MTSRIGYQAFLAAAFFLGGAVGDAMTRFFASKTGASLPRERINSWMNYPYRNMFEDLSNGSARTNEDGYWPAMPLLFVHGTKKPVHFHSSAWLEHVERTGGEVVALEIGHWVSRHPEFNDILIRFLDRTD